ncbi:acyl-CoA dehydrogenase/oxidase [Lobosporangium transversale]|uniref:Acyl-CoA dehydrogenase/oxidase n=1 Tax=Lobosporangium transversale TaxID=64571 RepID=A0A1Y2G836_9FUNG|nr:acyl-CoA dehydrogenase/oxidase [Lobosporangium transversale]ORZ02043.1 acyl-CoA dehydrogenase/oxidase [Lobosporangium transversale]|eukprot:XP_021876271.1 acyl-CoA dehydrogenase/oxidase [Lobosporangium transversale]
MSGYFSVSQVASHNSENDCWIIVHDKVYDVSNFLNEHPGGKKIILKNAGTDATKQFDAFHNPGVLEKYGALCIGVIGEPPKDGAVEPSGESHANVEDDEFQFGEMIPFGDPSWYQQWGSPYYKESHRRLRRYVRKFVDTDIMPFAHEWDEAKQVPMFLFKKCAEMGILAAVAGNGTLPLEYFDVEQTTLFRGGDKAIVPTQEFDAFHGFIIFDELSRCGSGGVLWGILGGLGIGLPPIIKNGSEELKRRIVPEVLAGRKTICLAITEPAAGSDVANLTCVANEHGDGFIVNGEKKWITNGTFADYFTTAVRTGGEGMGGVSLLVIERSMPGVSTRQMKCSGVWSSGTAYINFEDVKVPRANIVGKENRGFKYIMNNFNHERMGIVIQANRLARVCLEEAIKYGSKRKTFGVKLVNHPVLRNKLAHMARQIEATHAWTENVIYQTITMPEDLQMIKLGGPIALLKAQATQTLEYCAREASQIFGGLAYTRGGQGEKVERIYREVRAYAIPGGSEEIMLDLGMRQSMKVATSMYGAKL